MNPSRICTEAFHEGRVVDTDEGRSKLQLPVAEDLAGRSPACPGFICALYMTRDAPNVDQLREECDNRPTIPHPLNMKQINRYLGPGNVLVWRVVKFSSTERYFLIKDVRREP